MAPARRGPDGQNARRVPKVVRAWKEKEEPVVGRVKRTGSNLAILSWPPSSA